MGSIGIRRGRDPHRLDHARVVVAFARELAQRLERLLVLLRPAHEDGRVVAGDASEIGHVADAVDPRLQQVLQRAVVFLEPELAQAEEGVGGAVLRGQAGDLAEGLLAAREVVLRVVRRALIPVALDVVGLQLHELRVEPDRLIPSLRLPRVGGGFQELLELGRLKRRWLGRRLSGGRGLRAAACCGAAVCAGESDGVTPITAAGGAGVISRPSASPRPRR